MKSHSSSRPLAALLSILCLTLSLASSCSGGGASHDAAPDPDAAPAGGTGEDPHAGASPHGENPHENLPFFRGVEGEGETGGNELAWEDPEGWIPVEPASRMRWAQYALPPAEGDTDEGECVVFYFGPGQGGDPESNAERWASQFQDAAGSPPEPDIERSAAGPRSVMKVFVEGTYAPSPMMGGSPAPAKAGYKLMGAIVEGPDANWFFKCTGPLLTIDAHRGAFDGLIASIRTR